MGLAGWSALSTESGNVASGMAAVASGGTSPVITDIDNTAALPTGRRVNLRLWITINMAAAVVAGGTITMSLRRKRSGVYADNDAERVTIPVNAGAAGMRTVECILRIPAGDVYGLFLRNDMGNNTPGAGGVTIIWDTLTEEVT
jgi:hypothetical protein